MKNLISVMVAFATILSATAQQPAYNQNSARSNGVFERGTNDWSFGLSTGASFGLNNNEKNLFRGNSIATKFTGGYQLGAIGVGFTGGFAPGSISQTGINQFLTERKIQQGQVQISSANPFNSYFLLGPTFKLGEKVSFLAQLQGGFFLNNPGAVSILQNGATRPVYRFEGGTKNIAPGLSGSFQLAYPINNSTRFLINTDYLYSSSTVRLLDPGAGIDIATEQKRNFQLFTAGVGIVKILSPRDHASGQATGKRSREAGTEMATGKRNTTNAPREVGSGMASGKRILPFSPSNVDEMVSPRENGSGMPTGKRNDIAIDESGVHRINQSCGPVTQKITYSDGSSEEMTFSCPDDAAAFRSINGINNGMPNRISTNMTVGKQTQGATFGEKVNAGLHAAGGSLSQGKQTQGATFGEKVNQGLHAAGSALSQGAQLRVISGTLTWNTATGGTGIVTNAAVSSVSSLSGSGGGAASASYAATGKMTATNNGGNGSIATIYAREAGSGMATGRRQYEPVFLEGNSSGAVCSSCLASVSKNPLHSSNQNSGNNPLYNNDKKTVANAEDNDCHGVGGILVYLLDPESKAIIGQTNTSTCGEFWFANVPEGSYIVKLSGAVTNKKQYDVVIGNEGGTKDVAGTITMAADTWTLRINTSSEGSSSRLVNTSRSNIKRIVVIAADTDGDGVMENIRVNATYIDGSSADITSKCIINTSRSNIKQISIPYGAGSASPTNKTVNTSRSNIKNTTIAIGDVDGDGISRYTATATLSDGKNIDIASNTRVISHTNVVQLEIDTDDSDGDGLADLVWSPRSNINDAPATTNSNRKGWDGTIKGLAASVGDVDGDGVPEMIVGNNSSLQPGTALVGGSLPGGAVISSMVAGNPIGGLTIKGGKNPGGNLQSTRTNKYGEFEFTGWNAGTYTIETSQKIYIDDETIVSAIDLDTETIASRKGWDGTVKGGSRQSPATNFDDKTGATPETRARNNNTVRSNRTDQHLIDADLDGDGEYETSILNFNSEVASFAITEQGMPKSGKKASGGIKDTIKTQVKKSNSGNNTSVGPIKWMAPEIITRYTHVHGDPHVDTRDGTLIFGDNNDDAVSKSNWRSSEVGVKSVQCPDGTCYIITAKPGDFSTTSQKSIANLSATALQNAEVYLVTENETVYKRTTDQNGLISLNGLPPGVPIRMLLNVTVAGDEDIIVTFTTDSQGKSISNVLKTKHDTAKNSIGNIR